MQRPFPDHWKDHFDLVHMRFGLPAAVEWGPKRVVSNLVSALKPIGWIQLVEADWTDVSGCGPVLSETFSLFRMVFLKMGISEFTQKLEDWLSEEGLQSVGRQTFYIRIGARLEDKELGNAGAAIICQAATTLVGITKSCESPFYLKVMMCHTNLDLHCLSDSRIFVQHDPAHFGPEVKRRTGYHRRFLSSRGCIRPEDRLSSRLLMATLTNARRPLLVFLVLKMAAFCFVRQAGENYTSWRAIRHRPDFYSRFLLL